eukprot:m.49081 g.49081  ORF g.49081 m.49081 type:complete len:110 (-) comp6459_c0_seq2:4111-4440(-)
MYQQYGPQGFEILAFPCNQFLWQEPGTHEEIEEFARGKYGATFPLFEKIEVNGRGTHEVYKFLKAKTDVAKIDWNFAKFVIDKQGNVRHHSSAKYPTDIEGELKTLLSA